MKTIISTLAVTSILFAGNALAASVSFEVGPYGDNTQVEQLNTDNFDGATFQGKTAADDLFFGTN